MTEIMVDGTLRLSETQHQALQAHLLPGDGCEAVAITLCGRGGSPSTREILTVHEIHPIRYAQCHVRKPDQVSWKTDALLPLLESAARRNLGFVKIHSHPGGWESFSRLDDEADRALFPGIYGW